MKLKNILLAFTLILACSSVTLAQDIPTTVEAESGTLGSDFETLTDGDITYVTSMTDFLDANFPDSAIKVITFEITFPGPGTYDLYAKFRVGDGGANDDSFFYGNGFGEQGLDSADHWTRVNNVGTAGFTGEDQYVTGEGGAGTNLWKWLNLTEFGGDEAGTTFIVEDGDLTQTFQFGGREDGFDLDKFAFANADKFYTVGNLENEEEGADELPDPNATPPIADGLDKYLGNVYSNSQISGFTNYWNQVTPENAGKWGSVEGTRDVMNWAQLDNSYELARDNDFVFKLHVLIWGNQQPNWINSLEQADQLVEIRQWMDSLATRYPDLESIEVVNEPLHDPPDTDNEGGGNYIDALGGTGATGWDWVITSFELAREFFPDAKLMLNDYGIVGSTGETNNYLEIINLLKDRDLIDQIGVQGHAFTVNNLPANTIISNLDLLAATGIPIYVTELDIDGVTDELQLDRYKRIFPAFWEHAGVEGMTLWGFRPGMWRTDERAFLIEEDGETERPALIWLRAYVQDTYVPVTGINVTGAGGANTITVKDGTLQLTAELVPENSTIEQIEWSVDNESVATISETGLLTALDNGAIVATATSIDGDITGTLVVQISNQQDVVTGLDEIENLKIYPNPVNQGMFTVSGIQKYHQISLYDLRGNELQSFNVLDRNSIDIRINQSQGIYVVQLFDGKDYSFRKIVVN